MGEEMETVPTKKGSFFEQELMRRMHVPDGDVVDDVDGNGIDGIDGIGNATTHALCVDVEESVSEHSASDDLYGDAAIVNVIDGTHRGTCDGEVEVLQEVEETAMDEAL